MISINAYNDVRKIRSLIVISAVGADLVGWVCAGYGLGKTLSTSNYHPYAKWCVKYRVLVLLVVVLSEDLNAWKLFLFEERNIKPY